MKREELKAVDYDTIYANLPYINMLFYIATEADNVMDEMEQHIKELEEANKLAVIVGNKQAGRIKELEAENKALRQANLDCNAHFNTLKEDYEKLKAQEPKWISIRSNPNHPLNKDFLVAWLGKLNDTEFNDMAIRHSVELTNDFTHWMPLPPPPPTEESSATESEVK